MPPSLLQLKPDQLLRIGPLLGVTELPTRTGQAAREQATGNDRLPSHCSAAEKNSALNQAAVEKNHIRHDTGEGRQTRNMSAKAVSQPSQASIEQRQRKIQQDLWTVLYFSVHQKMTETYKNKYTWTIVMLTSCNESIFSMWIMERKKMVIQGNVIGVAWNVTDCTQTAHYISPSLLLCLLPLIWFFFCQVDTPIKNLLLFRQLTSVMSSSITEWWRRIKYIVLSHTLLVSGRFSSILQF